MRIFLKILMWMAISLCALISFAFVAFAIYDGTFYRKELRKIQKQLNPIFVLANAKEGHDFARSLHWEYEDAYYNKNPED